MSDDELAAIKTRLRNGYPSRGGLLSSLTVAKDDVAALVKRVNDLEVTLVYVVAALAKFDKATAIAVLRAQNKRRTPAPSDNPDEER